MESRANGEGDGECDTPQVCKPHTAVSSSSSHSSLITENRQADPSPSAHAAQTLVAPLPASLETNNEIKVPPIEEADTNVSCQYKVLTDCFVKLYDVFSKKVVPRRDETLKKTRKAVRPCVSQNTASKDISYQTTSQNKVPTTESLEPVINTVKALQSKTDCLTNVINEQCNDSSENSSHIEERGFICDICRKMYKLKSSLVKHIMTHAEARRFTCKICQYKCQYRCHLKRHMRTHTGERPFSCKLCNYKCTQNSSLVGHMRTHTGERPFSCKLCDYKFTDNSHLVRHLRTHTGERPFSCKSCDCKFTRNSHLVTHMRTHTGERPFSCKLCDYKFTRNSHLVMHLRTHTGERPFSCKLCDYKCAQNSTLVTHTRTHTAFVMFVSRMSPVTTGEGSEDELYNRQCVVCFV
nr:oocyte zinc finger protein XlCOF20-like [Maniola hyperantus]